MREGRCLPNAILARAAKKARRRRAEEQSAAAKAGHRGCRLVDGDDGPRRFRLRQLCLHRFLVSSHRRAHGTRRPDATTVAAGTGTDGKTGSGGKTCITKTVARRRAAGQPRG